MRRISAIKVAVLLSFSLFLIVQVPYAFAMPLVSWSPWSYHSAPANPPTTGQGATRWATDGNYLWQVDADTYSSVPLVQGNAMSADVWGYDRCSSTNPWTLRMSGGNTVYSGQSMDAGVQQGYFFDCGQGGDHSYQNYHDHDVVDNISSYYTSGGDFY